MPADGELGAHTSQVPGSIDGAATGLVVATASRARGGECGGRASKGLHECQGCRLASCGAHTAKPATRRVRDSSAANSPILSLQSAPVQVPHGDEQVGALADGVAVGVAVQAGGQHIVAQRPADVSRLGEEQLGLGARCRYSWGRHSGRVLHAQRGLASNPQPGQPCAFAPCCPCPHLRMRMGGCGYSRMLSAIVMRR